MRLNERDVAVLRERWPTMREQLQATVIPLGELSVTAVLGRGSFAQVRPRTDPRIPT